MVFVDQDILSQTRKTWLLISCSPLVVDDDDKHFPTCPIILDSFVCHFEMALGVLRTLTQVFSHDIVVAFLHLESQRVVPSNISNFLHLGHGFQMHHSCHVDGVFLIHPF
jgi:hypothetical protein